MATNTRQILGLGATLAVALGLAEASVAGTSIGALILWGVVAFAAIQFLPRSAEAPRYGRFAVYSTLFLLAWWASPPAVAPAGGALLVGAVGLAGLASLGVSSVWAGRNVGWQWALGLASLGALVALFSGGRGAPGGLVEWLVSTFGMSEGAAQGAALALRKAVHFTFYGTMGWAAWRYAARLGSTHSLWFAMAWTAAHAGFDELRQLEATGRTGAAIDVAIDLAGAAMAVAWASRGQRRAKSGT